MRNPKEPPRLPPRKAVLTGKWLDLRSRRRLRRDGLDLASASDMTEGAGGATLLRAGNGRIAAIDIDRLMAEAEAHEGGRATRRPFAQGFRAGAEGNAPTRDEVAERLRQSLRTLSRPIPSEPSQNVSDGGGGDDPVAAGTTVAVQSPRHLRFDLRRFLVGALAGLGAALVGAIAAIWVLSV
ncbi:hypothetical protein [Pararhodobacter sp. SW119]|uniref:hypothetical protein n=1 Tax=Pararhodobacter sp. SW119 TaxID=2780075 RepID=UPI001ADEC90C|nr:hypothetical protein [Pararhodobacter sp. SW119]